MKYTIDETTQTITILNIDGKIEEIVEQLSKIAKLFPDYSVHAEKDIVSIQPYITYPTNPAHHYSPMSPSIPNRPCDDNIVYCTNTTFPNKE
tara:strand:+ start:266 stop:541 length:276 start_codon:yes stop_codon:yes gene_type:complete